ncbi:hypothetical protein L9F63_017232, partial [Diploptera punctata]
WLWWFLRFSSAQDSECGRPEVPAFRMLGGEESLPGRWPWMAGIFITRRDGTRAFCAGSLIGPRHVLTAAHCARDFRSKCNDCRFDVKLSNFNLESDILSPVRSFIVVEVHAHPQFDYRLIDTYHDLAIMVLDRTPWRSRYLMPLCLPPPSVHNDMFEGQNATMVGWGLTSCTDTPKFPRQQMQMQITVWGNDDCGRRYSEPTINSSFICAGDEIGGKTAYLGDSGGPLMIKYDGRWIQIGIVTFGEIETPYKPTVFTRVTEYMDWIQEIILK